MQTRAAATATALVLADVAVLAESAAPAWRAVTNTGWLAARDADQLAAAPAQVGLCLVGLWLGVGLLAGAAACLPGVLGRAAHAVHVLLLPAALRRLLAGTAGLGVLIAPMGVASAAPPAGVTRPAFVTPVPPPVWPTTPAPSHGTTTRPASEQVTVTAGDSLWLLATQHLGSGSGDAAVAGYWPRIYHANRAVIGDDPDLVLPGQHLTLPTPDPAPKETHR